MRPPVLSRYVYIAVSLAAVVAVSLPVALTNWLTPSSRTATLEGANQILAMVNLESAQSITEAATALRLRDDESTEVDTGDVEAELASFVGNIRVTQRLLSEGGPYELLQALLLLGAAGLLLWTFYQEPQSIELGALVAPRNYFILILGIGLLVAFGVEIGWGTRIFSAPAIVKSSTRIYLKSAWLIAMLVYLGILPLVVSAVGPLARLVDKAHFPIADWPIGLLGVALFVPSLFTLNTQVPELLFAILLFTLSLEVYRVEKNGRPQVEVEPIRFGPAVFAPPLYVIVATLGVVAIFLPIFLPGRLLPSDEDSALALANRLLSRDGIEVNSLEEAATVMGVPEGENRMELLFQHLGRTRSEFLLFSEDGIYETLQAILCGAGVIILLWTFFRRRTELDLGVIKLSRNIFLLAMAFMMFVMLGEEVSWGQRLLRFGTPEWLTLRNFQGEFTFHNIRTFQVSEQGNSLEVGWLWIMVVYLGFFPFALAIVRPVGKWFEQFQIPVADWPLGCITLFLFFLNAAWFRTSEVTELIIDILLVVLVLEIYWNASQEEPREEHQRLLFAVGIWSTLWCLSLPFQAGEDSLPSVKSTDSYKAAIVLLEQGNQEQAIEKLEESLDLWPNNVQAHHTLALLLLEQDETESAIEHLNDALRIEPRYIPSLLSLATVYSQENRWAEAIDMFRRVIETEPQFQNLLARRADLLQAINNVAWIMATQPDESLRDGFGAVELSEQLCEATDFEIPSYMDTLAAALAETGEFERAQELAAQAIDIALDADNISLAAAIQDRLNHYEDGKPYRDESLE